MTAPESPGNGFFWAPPAELTQRVPADKPRRGNAWEQRYSESSAATLATRHRDDTGPNGFGYRLTELRIARRLRASYVSGQLGLDRNTLNAYERGTRHPDFWVFLEIAKYYGVTLEYLAYGKKG